MNDRLFAFTVLARRTIAGTPQRTATIQPTTIGTAWPGVDDPTQIESPDILRSSPALRASES